MKEIMNEIEGEVNDKEVIVGTESDDNNNNDVNFNYDNAMDVEFEGSNECNDDFMKYGIKNMLHFVHDTKGSNKNISTWDI